MTEKELIAKIKELKQSEQIKPRQDWVVLTKSRIIGESFKTRDKFSFIEEIKAIIHFTLNHKPAFSTLTALVILIGILGFAQSSLPGDMLYPVRRVTERGQRVFVSEQDRSIIDLETVNKRLDDLAQVARKNSVKNLASAINEFQASASEAAKTLSKRDTKDINVVKDIISEVKKIEEKKEQMQTLGIEIGESEELDTALAQLVEREIKDLENRSLTEKQEEILGEIKEDYEQKNYYKALEKFLFLSCPEQITE